MPNTKPTYWLPIAILAAFLAVSIFGIVTYINTMKIREGERRVARSYAIREATHQMLSAMKDTETGERGFLLTGDLSHLEPYHEGIERANERFTELTDLASDNTEIQPYLVGLRETFEKQQDHLAKAIELRKRQPSIRVSDEVLDLVKSGRGKEAMDSARNVARKILDAESEKLRENEASTKFLASMSQSTITAGHLIALALILTAGFAAHVDRRKRDAAEVALLKEQNELAAVINSAFEGIVAFSSDYAIRFMNPAAAEILAVDRDKANGMSLLQFIPSAQHQKATEGLTRFAASGETELGFFGITLLRYDGTEFPCEGTAFRTILDDDQFTTIKIRDLTETQASRAKQREYTAILEQIKDAVLVCDLDGHVRLCNSSAESLLGVNETEMIGKSVGELLSADPQQWAEDRQTLFATGLSISKRSWISPAGREIILEQRRSLIRDESGEPTGKLLFLIDITDRIREEAKERRSQRLESIGTLAGGIAHDLNNVLTPIIMSAKLLKRGSRTPERLIDNIVTSADRGGRMIKKLLAFAGGDVTERQQVDLREILSELEEILSHTLRQTIDLQVLMPDDLRMIDGDSTELSQVVMNLAINARDAMPRGGRLEIEVENFTVDQSRAAHSDNLKAGPHVLLSVSDTGEGIPKEFIDRIFDPFFTTKAQGKGTGLGLATTLGIVRSYGGDITVYSEPGTGTKFSIYLPSSKLSADVAARPNDEVEIPTGKGETILIVDDEALILETARETLELNHYRVIAAGSGSDAVAIYQHQGKQIDLVLLDIMMPGMDGLDTKDAMRSINPQVRVIGSSGLRRPGSEGSPLQDVNGFLPKPYTDEQLLRLVRDVLDKETTKIS